MSDFARLKIEGDPAQPRSLRVSVGGVLLPVRDFALEAGADGKNTVVLRLSARVCDIDIKSAPRIAPAPIALDADA